MARTTTPIDREFHAATPRKTLDLKLGFALLTDRRVALRYKIGAVAIGFAAFAVLACFEIPVEEIVALVPFLGIIGDAALDGAEAIYVPVLLACVMLPYLAPATVVDRIRRERDPGAHPAEGPVIDV